MKNAELMKKFGASTARIICALALFFGISGAVYWLWTPGSNQRLSSGGNHAIWLGHGWLGADSWFLRYGKKKEAFRSDRAVQELLEKLSANHIRCVYPHLCPVQRNGSIAEYDSVQMEKFLDVAAANHIKVLPWAGGVLDESARISDPAWRKNFVSSIEKLFQAHPRLSGIQVNIEPMPDGDPDFLRLLEEIKKSIGNKILSVAAYPPPTLWQRSMQVHWSLDYITEVAKRSDQLAVMMYDTAVPLRKCYIRLMKQWTKELISAVSGTENELILGIPAYEDPGVGYHHPQVENITSALQGIAAAAGNGKSIGGIAIYCEWEMTPEKWRIWKKQCGLSDTN